MGDRQQGAVIRPAIERTATQRFDTVDILRGGSTLAVILVHIFTSMYLAGLDLEKMLPAWLGHLLLRNGRNGVTVFFAVSGFLITLNSVKRFGSLAGMKPLQFYRIRFARIMPLLLLLLAVLSVLDLAHVEGFVIDPRRHTLPHALFSALTFHLNRYEATHGYLPANWNILWSLSVEETFYLFFPLLCIAMLRWKHGFRLFVAVLLAFVAMGPFARTVWTSNGIWRDSGYLGCMDAISLGCLTALLVAWRQRRQNSAGLLLALQILGSLLIFWIALRPSWAWIQSTMQLVKGTGLDGTILPLGTCLVIFGSVLRNMTGDLWTAPLRWFGRHSYEIYMTHEFVAVFGTQLFFSTKRGSVWLWVVAMVVLTAPLGWLVARFFSEPMNRRLRGASPTTAGRIQSA